MPKLDISVDKEFNDGWKNYLKEHPEFNASGLVRKLIRDYLIKEGVIEVKNNGAKRRGNKRA